MGTRSHKSVPLEPRKAISAIKSATLSDIIDPVTVTYSLKNRVNFHSTLLEKKGSLAVPQVEPLKVL